MDLVFDEIVRSSKEFGSKKDDRGGSVSDLFILLLSQGYQDSSLIGSGSVIIVSELGEKREKERGGVTAGWVTSRSLRMVAPSLVMVTSPMLSTIIWKVKESG